MDLTLLCVWKWDTAEHERYCLGMAALRMDAIEDQGHGGLCTDILSNVHNHTRMSLWLGHGCSGDWMCAEKNVLPTCWCRAFPQLPKGKKKWNPIRKKSNGIREQRSSKRWRLRVHRSKRRRHIWLRRRTHGARTQQSMNIFLDAAGIPGVLAQQLPWCAT